MPAFQEMFPELSAELPLMAGDLPQAPSVLGKMRRQQLSDIARAWEIPVKMSGTKPEMMPLLLAAESAGTFRTPPIHPEFARKAMRNSDEPPFPNIIPKEGEIPHYRGMDIHQLVEACEAKGIDTNRRGGDYMIRALEKTHGPIVPTAHSIAAES